MPIIPITAISAEPPISTLAPTEPAFTPTEEASTPTQAATEEVTITASAPESEIIDGKGAAMVLVPASDFPMGSSNGGADERPIHSVYLDDYYIDKFEVTNALYKVCVNAGVCNPPIHTGSFTRSSYYGNAQYDQYPVVYMDWNMANTYCEWRGAHLPTEAQWEKAARGTDARIYPWGRDADCQKANYQGSGNGCVGGTSKVGNYESGKSPYGAYDMAGNVWEWVSDWYSEAYYQTSLSSNPIGPDFGLSRVLRGGSWSRGQYEIRASERNKFKPDYYNFDIGFRCANSLP
jgi:serine/threonine-protein kinase